jgi:glucosamine kinase
MRKDALLLGIDGGGTRCRARLADASGAVLAESTAGPANIRFGLPQSFAAVLEATHDCLARASLSPRDLARMTACLALAGASEPSHLKAAQNYRHPFGKALVTTDAHAACVGAHAGHDGGVIVVGTGTIGWAELNGRAYRVGGWGLPVSDEGSGAWIGLEALRRVLWANDGRAEWTPLLRALFRKFDCDPHAVVRFTFDAKPRDFGGLAPLVVEHAEKGDPAAAELLGAAAGHIDALAARLVAFGALRLALAGGLASAIEPLLADATRRFIVPPAGDALAGALMLARMAAEAPTVPEDLHADQLVLELR